MPPESSSFPPERTTPGEKGAAVGFGLFPGPSPASKICEENVLLTGRTNDGQ